MHSFYRGTLKDNFGSFGGKINGIDTEYDRTGIFYSFHVGGVPVRINRDHIAKNGAVHVKSGNYEMTGYLR